MGDPSRPGQGAARSAAFLMVAAALCFIVSMAMGIAGIIGLFVSESGIAVGVVAAFLTLGLLLLWLGLKRRRAARAIGWRPAWEYEDDPSGPPRPKPSDLRPGERPDPERVEAAQVAWANQRAHMEGDGNREGSERETGDGPAASHGGDTAMEAPPGDNQMRTIGTEIPADRIVETFSNFRPRVDIGASKPGHFSVRLAKERIATVERMLLRSEDAFAAARDLVASGRTVDAFAGLSDMLSQSDALKLAEPPRLKPIKLSRSNRYWLGGDVPEASDEIFDAVTSLEAAFNINHDITMAEANHPDRCDGKGTFAKARDVLAATVDVQPHYQSHSNELTSAYAGESAGSSSSEWGLRMNIANAAENASLPFRIVFDMRTNAAERLALIRLQVPRPSCFSIAASNVVQQQALARDYALRSAVFMAKAALNVPNASNAADLVVVTCHARESDQVILSLEATRAEVAELESMLHCAMPLEDASHPSLHMSWKDAWLDPVDAHIEADDPLFDPDRYSMSIELSKDACGDLLAKASNAAHESDLGILEGAARRQAWDNLQGRLGFTAESAVSATKELQSATDDLSVQHACSRLMRALVDGTAEPGQTDEMEGIFMDDDALDEALASAATAFVSHKEADVEQAVFKLKKALSPSMQIAYLDDTESVYRHFRSTAERLIYNLHHADRRSVRMVPRSYYAANELIVHLLCLLGRAEEAEAYADEIVRIAPISASAIMTKARVLEDLSRLFEASNLVNASILEAPTVHDAALCYYRMAYLQWRTGRHDVAAACYRASIALRTDIAPQAQAELDELLESDDELHDYSQIEAPDVMRDGGVNIWPMEERRAEIAKAAVLCTDEKLYPAAHQLSVALLEFRHDDALIDVCRSLS